MKRRDFIKVFGTSLLTIPHTSFCKTNNLHCKENSSLLRINKNIHNPGFETGFQHVDEYLSLGLNANKKVSHGSSSW